MQKENRSTVEFIPQFQKAFFHPRYWGVWAGVGALAALAHIPARFRDPVLGAVGRLGGRLAKSPRRRAKINLIYCFPDMPEAQREALLDEMFATALQTMMLMVELGARDPKKIQDSVVWHGEEHLKKARDEGRNIILLVPHAWGIDIPAMLLADRGLKVAGMFHNQKNPLTDWLWNRTRRRFGGRLHARQDGIKPFIASVREGYLGYYLPDEDHGEEQSEFVDFFATYKATLPAIGRLMKVCRADIIPLFPVYNAKAGRLEIHIRPAMYDLADAELPYIARRMNEEVEILVTPNPEQYAWILKLLKTRRNGETEPYRRDDL